jgi:hypothetical protein
MVSYGNLDLRNSAPQKALYAKPCLLLRLAPRCENMCTLLAFVLTLWLQSLYNLVTYFIFLGTRCDAVG